MPKLNLFDYVDIDLPKINRMNRNRKTHSIKLIKISNYKDAINWCVRMTSERPHINNSWHTSINKLDGDQNIEFYFECENIAVHFKLMGF